MRAGSAGTRRTGPLKKAGLGICRGAIPGPFLVRALQLADVVAVGQLGPQVVAVVLALAPTFISPLIAGAWPSTPIPRPQLPHHHCHLSLSITTQWRGDGVGGRGREGGGDRQPAPAAMTGRPVCLPHELYIDVACSAYEHRAHGAETLRRFLAHWKKRGVKAIRLYATQATLAVWGERWGFREAESVLRADGTCVYGRKRRSAYPTEPGTRVPTGAGDSRGPPIRAADLSHDARPVAPARTARCCVRFHTACVRRRTVLGRVTTAGLRGKGHSE